MKVCRLLKSLYGLKQASRQWYAKLSQALLSYGFVQGNSDCSLFIKKSESSFMALLVYVDDVLLASDSILEIERLKTFLDANIFLCQRKYILDILEDTGLTRSKPIAFPMESTLKLSANDTNFYEDPSGYRRLIGRLFYLTLTKPDLAYSCIRVLRYLKAILGQGCVDTRRSVTGFAIFLGNSLISWKSKKQVTVSRSSAEVEYQALATATCEIQWLFNALQDLDIKHSQSALLYTDSKSAMPIATNPVQHERTKHI
ncbi:hypothetical protein AAG906_040799 [Vitis piasezkii]